MLLLAGCISKRVIEDGKNPSLESILKSPIVEIKIDYPLGMVTPYNNLIVSFYNTKSSSFDYDYQYKIENDGPFIITDMESGIYDVEAYIDLNSSHKLEIGEDAIGGKMATDYDPRLTGTIVIDKNKTTEIILNILHPIDSITPKRGEIGVGNYCRFSWEKIIGVKKYKLKVFRNESIKYMVSTTENTIKYGELPKNGSGNIIVFPEKLNNDKYYRWNILGLDENDKPVAYSSSKRFIP